MCVLFLMQFSDLEFAGKSETLFNTISSSFATLVLFTTNFGLSLTKVMTEFREVCAPIDLKLAIF